MPSERRRQVDRGGLRNYKHRPGCFIRIVEGLNCTIRILEVEVSGANPIEGWIWRESATLW
jgi:hypothetical protein